MSTYTIIDRQDEGSRILADKIRETLNSAGYREDTGVPDTVFVVGGDGTFLYAVHQYLEHLDHVRFYGIHTGTLGFFTDYRESELDAFLAAFLEGDVKESVYPLLQISDGRNLMYGLNEVRVENMTKTQVIDVYINGTFFETFRGTGLLVSTQLGSTAYSRSLGGAVIEEGLDVIQLCEIAGIHHIKYRSLGSPVILHGTAVIELRSGNYEGAVIGADSSVLSLNDTEVLTIRMSDRKVRMLKGRDVSYFRRLQSLF